LTNNRTEFAEKFLDAYLSPCFGSLSKKEIDLLVFGLLMESKEIDISKGLHSVSRQLRIPITKVKTLLYEKQLRDKGCDDEWFRKEIAEALKRTRFHIDGKKQEILLCIENPMLRKELESTIKLLNSFADYSFNSEILRLDFEVYPLLLAKIMSDKVEQKKLEDALKVALNKAKDDPISQQELYREFLKGVAKKTGEEVADLSFTALTGGANKFLSLAKNLLS
jgi:hypothetical protein